jgi:hypothetical protein
MNAEIVRAGLSVCAGILVVVIILLAPVAIEILYKRYTASRRNMLHEKRAGEQS